MVVKRLKEGSFKERKLEKTRRRRKVQDSKRRIAEGHGRNDPCPMLEFSVMPIAQLQSAPRRTRKISQDHVERIARSISDHGFYVPILVRGEYIIDGHTRVAAAKLLFMTDIPVIQCKHLSDTQTRTLALAVNRTAEKGEWDLEQLKIEFEELVELDVDLESAGFSLEEADIILLDPFDTDEADGADDVPDPPKEPITQFGDIWALDEHRIICGDSLKQSTYQTLMAGDVADAVLTDPPYNVPIKGHVSGLGKTVHDEFAMASGEMTDEEFRDFLSTSLKQLADSARDGSVLFVFMDWRSIADLVNVGEAAGLKLINLVVWYKESGGMGGLYRSSHELVAVFCKGDTPHTNNVELGKHGRDRQNVWCVPGANRPGSSANAMLKLHATPKPVELISDAVLDVTSRGDIVLDAFLGSGTTLIAAERTGRQCRGIELEPRFVDVAIDRWQQLTGRDAILMSTGQAWSDVAARLGDTPDEMQGEES